MASSGSMTLRNAVDTWVRSSAPGFNFSGTNRIGTQTGAAYGLIFFNRPFPFGATIVSATLRLYTAGAWGATPTVTAKRIDEPWKVSRVTWDTKPAVTGSGVSVTHASNVDADEWAFDLTALMQNVSDGGHWFGVRLETTAAGLKHFNSAGAPDHKPTLQIEWTTAPDAPSTLLPSGGRSTSIAKPILRFDFTDDTGNTAMRAAQVQINGTNSWSSPSFDSGTVLMSEPELDLASTAYAGLAAGASTYWRVRVQDGSGLWSDWSDPAFFQRTAKATVSITNPPVSGLVTDWTPPILWTVSGGTQSSYQVLVTAVDDRSVVKYDSGRITTSVTGKTLPKGVLRDNRSYQVIVRVWDAVDREGTPGDTGFTSASRDFTFNEDATTNPVTGLTATALSPQPWVRLNWSRSTAPDSFAVKRDGAVVESGLDPADVLVSGTSYTWTDREATPGVSHDWVVQAVVNGKASAGNSTVTAKAVMAGVWLSDNVRDIQACIVQADVGGYSMGEDAETYFPVGSSTGIRVTQALRSWEGSVSGLFADYAGKTADQWANAMLSIRSHPGRKLVLHVNRQAFEVVVGNVVVSPTGNLPGTRDVKFDFWSQDPDYETSL